MTFTRATYIEVQQQIAQAVSLRDRYASLSGIRTVAGADISCGRFDKTGFASVLVFRFPEMELIDQAQSIRALDVPYVPGFLSFREGPLILDCLSSLRALPDVLICDGQGLAHPRRAGLACHIGVEAGLPAIGCAKTRLIGDHDEPGIEKGSRVPLTIDGALVGEVVRSKKKVNPLYISPGHQVSIAMASEIVLACCTRYRLPEPTRLAHLRVNEIRKGYSASRSS